MKKIMFDDKYDLTKAVLEGRKTMTRRVIPVDETKGGLVPVSFWDGKWCGSHGRPLKRQPYKVGEVVAVAQSYHALNKAGFVAPEWCEHTCEDSPGYSNKMFVRADLMPYQIRITGVWVERLQDISDEDCKKEGLEFRAGWNYHSHRGAFYTPRDAFAALIDKIFGKGTWESNPWVFVYEFELVK